MNKKMNSTECVMPGCALAMVYSPMQMWGATYDVGLALERGTIFPDLDKPFLMGGEAVSEREKMLMAVQQYHFAMEDAGMFLDAHPEDMKALAYFKKITELQKQAVADYEARFGPLTIASAAGTDRWNWIDSPWPWEMED